MKKFLAIISAMNAKLTVLTGKGVALKQQPKTPAATVEKPVTSFWCSSRRRSELLDRRVEFLERTWLNKKTSYFPLHVCEQTSLSRSAPGAKAVYADAHFLELKPSTPTHTSRASLMPQELQLPSTVCAVCAMLQPNLNVPTGAAPALS